jgi:hypothetical protein
VLSRPAVEAGENLGFLPGDMRDKLDPYLRPLYDALNDRLGAKRLRQNLDDGTIEIAPVAFMRGRTLNNSFVLIDEAQNCTYGQLKMLLTRLGWHSTMVITGDPDQTDLLPDCRAWAALPSASRLRGRRRGAAVRQGRRAPSLGRPHAFCALQRSLDGLLRPSPGLNADVRAASRANCPVINRSIGVSTYRDF